MRTTLFLLITALTGCVGAGPSGSELAVGCSDSTRGLGSDAVEATARLNCYREMIGLGRVSLDADLSAAAQAHANYMQATGEYSHTQSSPSHHLFSGSQVLDRLNSAGAQLDTSADGVHEVLAFHTAGADPTLAVDLWMDTVFHREPLVTPSLTAVGFGTAGIYSVMELVAPWEAPAETKLARYPAPGQGDARTHFDSDAETPDPLPGLGEVGVPITITALAPVWLGDDDPYGLSINEALSRLTSAQGAQRGLVFLAPASSPTLLRTIAAVPTAPLPPHSSWDVTLVFTLNGEQFEESWSFATGE